MKYVPNMDFHIFLPSRFLKDLDHTPLLVAQGCFYYSVSKQLILDQLLENSTSLLCSL